MKQSASASASLEGSPFKGTYSVRRVTYTNPETGYAVVHLVPADRPSATGLVAVGHFGEPRTGDCYRVEGVWRRDPRHGMQVRVSSVLPDMPQSLTAIERYLGGASIKGLGPHYARALVAHFGEETFAELQSGGQHLEEVSGIGPVRAQMIRDSWAEHEGIHRLMVDLQGIAGLSPNQAQRIYRSYGRDSWGVVSQNPYLLAEQVRGFGFKTCDRIARALGIAENSPQRLQAAIVHLLNRALAEGHLWSSMTTLVAEASTLLGVTPESIPPQVDALLSQERVTGEQIAEAGISSSVMALYLPQVARTETRVAERLGYLLRHPPRTALHLSRSQADHVVARLAQADLTVEQRRAVGGVLTGNRLSILTGGPGTGKTTTVRLLIACLEALQVSYALCATTGRASKQLAVLTGRNAATVHRHLRIGVGRHDVEAVRESVLIIDESSMIDIWLLDQIVARLTDATHLFLVGDVDQLPSVGPGTVLQDLIAAAEDAHLPGILVTRLTRVFRQEAGKGSMIVANCHRVRAGDRPIRDVPRDSDYFEMFRDTPREARELAVDLVSRRLPKFLAVPPSEVQVLAPMHGGEAGVRALNVALQQALNPPAPHKVELGLAGVGAGSPVRRILRDGDKVRQTKNDYQKRVFNGDLGIITRIDPENKLITVRFDDHSVLYEFGELEQLVHAWAMTVHSAQGSQWPGLVIVMLTSHYVMLERHILYTALSRAQRLAVLITQDKAVRIAVSQDRSGRRRTTLVRRLSVAMAGLAATEAKSLPRSRLF